jgi:hypothetical protein
MIAVRQLVRFEYVNPFLEISELPTAPQWSVIGLFVVLFVAGLATLGWMLKKVFRHPAAFRAASAD